MRQGFAALDVERPTGVACGFGEGACRRADVDQVAEIDRVAGRKATNYHAEACHVIQAEYSTRARESHGLTSGHRAGDSRPAAGDRKAASRQAACRYGHGRTAQYVGAADDARRIDERHAAGADDGVTVDAAADTFSRPPVNMTAPLATPPEDANSVPPEKTMIPLATPPVLPRDGGASGRRTGGRWPGEKITSFESALVSLEGSSAICGA